MKFIIIYGIHLPLVSHEEEARMLSCSLSILCQVRNESTDGSLILLTKQAKNRDSGVLKYYNLVGYFVPLFNTLLTQFLILVLHISSMWKTYSTNLRNMNHENYICIASGSSFCVLHTNLMVYTFKKTCTCTHIILNCVSCVIC